MSSADSPSGSVVILKYTVRFHTFPGSKCFITFGFTQSFRFLLYTAVFLAAQRVSNLALKLTLAEVFFFHAGRIGRGQYLSDLSEGYDVLLFLDSIEEVMQLSAESQMDPDFAARIDLVQA